MQEKILFTVDTPYREHLHVYGWQFGNENKKTLAVMGALRGTEIQQMYSCGLLIEALKAIEEDGMLDPECGILVIPCANQFSMNVNRRFWAADNTDINRMFPGYDLGETTQRIAASIFEHLKDYYYGIHMTSYYLEGNVSPHIRIMETGYEHPEDALAFGLPYVLMRQPKPYDTTTLNYNWQIWDTRAFSIFTAETSTVDFGVAIQTVDAVLRFLNRMGYTKRRIPESCITNSFRERDMASILTTCGGLLVHHVAPNMSFAEGDELGYIVDPCTAEIKERIFAPISGRLFFAHKPTLVNSKDTAFRLIPLDCLK